MSYLITESLTPKMKEEAESLIERVRSSEESGDELSPEVKARLFDLFLQREDMITFASDFKDMMAFFGDVDETDPFNWSQFSISDPQEWQTHVKFRSAMGKRELDLEKSYKYAAGNKKTLADYLEHIVEQDDTKILNSSPQFDTANLPKDYDIPKQADNDDADESEEQKKLRKLAIEKLRQGEELDANLIRSLGENESVLDAEGNEWSGVILDTDIVQHTLPRNREQSDRCLVMVGNMRGVGGFGMGKGKTPAEAADKAFRFASCATRTLRAILVAKFKVLSFVFL